MSGPCIALLPPRVRAEHDAGDRGDKQHDRRHLEREQVVGQEELPDLARRAEAPPDVTGLGKEPAGLEADDDDHLDEHRTARGDRTEHLLRRAARPRRLLAAIDESRGYE